VGSSLPIRDRALAREGGDDRGDRECVVDGIDGVLVVSPPSDYYANSKMD
jgi:hypothetical protein